MLRSPPTTRVGALVERSRVPPARSRFPVRVRVRGPVPKSRVPADRVRLAAVRFWVAMVKVPAPDLLKAGWAVAALGVKVWAEAPENSSVPVPGFRDEMPEKSAFP